MVVCGIFSVLVRRYGAIPRSLFPAFRLLVVDPGFISLKFFLESHHILLQSVSKVLAGINTSFFHSAVSWRGIHLADTLWNCRISWTIWCADPLLLSICAAISFTVRRRFSFTMTSTAAMASDVTTRCVWPGRGESVTELMPSMNFLVHSYSCRSDRQASPYWTFICRWISMSFTPSLLKKRMTERCSSLVHVTSGPPSLHYYCAVVLHSCIVLPPVSHSSTHE